MKRATATVPKGSSRLTDELPIPQVLLPAKLVAGLTPGDIDELAAVLAAHEDSPT